MQVVVIASQKGGSGKTTLAGHLAVEAEKANAGPVALIDTDPQGSLSQWWNARAVQTPSFAKVGVFELSSALAHLKRTGMQLVIIDTPPAISESISQVVAHADLVIVPTRPSPHDLRAVGATVDIAERHKKPLIFVMNGATARARITGESAVALSQHGTVAPTTIHHRVDFAASMVDGRTVGEVVPKSQSTKEIADLWIYVHDRLGRLAKDPAMQAQTQAPAGATALIPPAYSVPSYAAVSDENDFEPAAANGEADDLPPLVPQMPSMPPMPSMARHQAVDPLIIAEMPAPEPLPYLGPDRRSGGERRDVPAARGQTLFNGPERRANPFGRRHTD